MRRYSDEKAIRGLLDFDDLVARASDLLVDGHLRAWVLFKLDQGIDHILVDEAQDFGGVLLEMVHQFVRPKRGGLHGDSRSARP